MIINQFIQLLFLKPLLHVRHCASTGKNRLSKIDLVPICNRLEWFLALMGLSELDQLVAHSSKQSQYPASAPRINLKTEILPLLLDELLILLWRNPKRDMDNWKEHPKNLLRLICKHGYQWRISYIFWLGLLRGSMILFEQFLKLIIQIRFIRNFQNNVYHHSLKIKFSNKVLLSVYITLINFNWNSILFDLGVKIWWCKAWCPQRRVLSGSLRLVTIHLLFDSTELFYILHALALS